jgi:hypothetical protein
MAATIPAAREAASTPSASSPAPQAQDRRLRLEDILKLMVVDGLVPAADADKLARARGSRASTRSGKATQKWAATPPWRSRSTGSSNGSPASLAFRICVDPLKMISPR